MKLVGPSSNHAEGLGKLTGKLADKRKMLEIFAIGARMIAMPGNVWKAAWLL
jgi:hypothetical protein